MEEHVPNDIKPVENHESLTHKIEVIFQNNAYLVWSVEDIRRLREQYRIVGSLVGPSASHPRQDGEHGLPLEIMAEEVALLVEKGVAELVEYPELINPSPEYEEFVNCARQNACETQVKEYVEKRKEFILAKADMILAGKRKKFEKEHPDAEFNADQALEEELTKIIPFPEASAKIPLFISHPCLSSYKRVEIELPVPNAIQSVRRKAYAALWEKGVYLTSGEKFGGDFLVYPSDPCVCHAQCIAVCVTGPITGRELVSKGRLGTSVKKTVVFCYEHEREIKFQSIQWMSLS